MSYEKRYDFRGGGPFSSITGIIIAILFFLLLFYLTKIVFKILWFLSPFLFVASLIIDHTVFMGFVKWMGGMLRRNPLMGIGAIVLSALLFPLTASFLFGKALFRKKMNDARKEYENKTQGELIEFEEIVEDDADLREENLRLPPIEREPSRRPAARKGNEYDNLFD